MPEAAPRVEQQPSPEYQKASQGLMLHIASGDFDATHTTQLNKAPTEIARKSFDALDAQHDKIRGQQQEKYDFIHKEILKKQNWPEDKIAPEILRHFHMLHWAKTESGRIQDMFSHVNEVFKNNEEQRAEVHKTILSALTNLHILINDDTDVSNFADKLYQTTSNTSGIPGEFYNQFCTGDTNAKLIQALSEEEMMAIKPFLIDVLGSSDAYDALLATKQTQDALAAKTDLSQGTTTVGPNEQHILHYFKQGEELLGTRSVTSSTEPQRTAPKVEPSKPTETLRSHISGVGMSESQGKRAEMEDTHIVEKNFGGKTDRSFYAIYDGHGGRQVADKAAQQLHQNLIQQLDEKHLSHLDALSAAYAATDESMKNEQTPGGATALTVLVDGNKLYVANLGDARAVMIHGDGQTERLSRDRKANDPSEQQEIVARGGTIAQDRVAGKPDAQGRMSLIAVSAALGDYDHKGLRKEPDAREVTISPTDKWVVMACDGVWDVIKDEEVAGIIGSETDPQKVSALLLGEATKRGSTDNISVIVLSLVNEEKTQEQEDELPQQIETIMAKLHLPGIRRLGKEIIFTDEELQQMQTLTQETKQLLNQNAPLQDLLRTIKHYVSIDTGFEIAAGFGNGIVANPDISAPRVIPCSNNQPMRIEVPPQLYELYSAHNNAAVVLSLLQAYRDSLGKGGTGSLGSMFAGNLEKTLAGYRQLKPQSTA